MEKVNETPKLPASLAALIPKSADLDCHALLTHIYRSLEPSIANHSLRVFLLATQLAQQQSKPGVLSFTNPSQVQTEYVVEPQVLFAASLFHDMGTCPSCNGPSRFEIEGADAAVTYLRSAGLRDEQSLHQIWSGIALHTSSGIAERIHPFVWLVRVAVKADFVPAIRDSLGLTAFGVEIEKHLPRLDIEQRLAAALVAQATRGEKEQGLYVDDGSGKWTDSVKFPKQSWPGLLLRGHLEKVRDEGPDWKGPNPAF